MSDTLSDKEIREIAQRMFKSGDQSGVHLANAVLQRYQRIYIVEIREKNGDEATLIHLASSKEKAIEYCKENPDCARRDELWWWAVYVEELDNPEFAEDNELFFLDWDGNFLENQPIK